MGASAVGASTVSRQRPPRLHQTEFTVRTLARPGRKGVLTGRARHFGLVEIDDMMGCPKLFLGNTRQPVLVQTHLGGFDVVARDRERKLRTSGVAA